MGHALDRANERLVAAGIDPDKVHAKATHIATVSGRYYASVAVLMTTLPTVHGDDNPDLYSRDSNGNEVWMVARDGRLVTLMLRRDDQPKTPDAFRVDKVLRMTA